MDNTNEIEMFLPEEMQSNNKIPIIYLIVRWCTKRLRINFIGLFLLLLLFLLGCWIYVKWTTIPEKHFHYNLVKLYGRDRIKDVEIDVFLDYSQVTDEDNNYPSYTRVKVIRDTSMYDPGISDKDTFVDHERKTLSVDSLRDAAIKYGVLNNKFPNADSISSLFLFEFSQTCDKSSRMSKSIFSDNNDNTFMFEMGSRRIHFEKRMNQYILGRNRNLKTRYDATTNIIIGGTNSNWDYCSFQLLNDLTAIKSLFASEDISQTNVFLEVEGKGLSTVRMFFGTAAKFSAMSPKPNEVGRRNIVFKENSKRPGINVDFHVEFPEARSLQDTRMFFLTTFLSIIITLFLTLTGNTIRRYWRLYMRRFTQIRSLPPRIVEIKADKEEITNKKSNSPRRRKKRSNKSKDTNNEQHRNN